MVTQLLNLLQQSEETYVSTINNNTQIQGVHQGTPTENENFLKLQNVLALVQDNLQSRDFEQDFVGWKNLNEGQN